MKFLHFFIQSGWKLDNFVKYWILTNYNKLIFFCIYVITPNVVVLVLAVCVSVDLLSLSVVLEMFDEHCITIYCLCFSGPSKSECRVGDVWWAGSTWAEWPADGHTRDDQLSDQAVWSPGPGLPHPGQCTPLCRSAAQLAAQRLRQVTPPPPLLRKTPTSQ